ncbi:hypothetical protein DPEC_G00348910 [Dallia pectoralis]|uniref:Uncharacterized protein n=1 Tax=Dallia pectoralis TaxID=75939 RepID=A0ACC2F1B7_DALPE|nr:hypothetical protein DPEC_G00348910 [Dallia pectoralis]
MLIVAGTWAVLTVVEEESWSEPGLHIGEQVNKTSPALGHQDYRFGMPDFTGSGRPSSVRVLVWLGFTSSRSEEHEVTGLGIIKRDNQTVAGLRDWAQTGLRDMNHT